MFSKIEWIDKYIILGIIGSFVILYGYQQTIPQFYYLFGSFLLILTAIHYKLIYFIALEVILASGHLAILLGLDQYTQMTLPIFLCFQLLIFYLMVGKENNIFLLIGIIGIALHSIGFAYNNPWIFFSGSSFIAIYAYYNGFKGQNPSYIWAILNTIFALVALYPILLHLR